MIYGRSNIIGGRNRFGNSGIAGRCRGRPKNGKMDT